MTSVKARLHPSDSALLPGDALEQIDTTLYHLQHMCDLINGLTSAGPPGTHTDGLDVEMFTVVFGWIGDELHDVRLALEPVHRALASA